jgi:futalosine hydrolase
MKILLVAATEAEIGPLIEYMEARWQKAAQGIFTNAAHELTICVTGVGMLAAAYSLTKVLTANTYDMAVQAGIAGSFDKDMEPGSTVWVTDEQMGDLGAEDHEKHLDIFDMGLINKDRPPFSHGRLVCPETDFHKNIDLPRVSGLTVNMVSGNAQTIQRLSERYGCQVESMEGAAFHYVCLAEGQPFIQVRSISNYIEPRDRSKWQIKEAVGELNDWLIYTLENLPATTVN